MPTIAAWIDWLRTQFDDRTIIDAQIAAGMRGEPTFYAQENGHQVGTPIPVAGVIVPCSDIPKRGQ